MTAFSNMAFETFEEDLPRSIWRVSWFRIYGKKDEKRLRCSDYFDSEIRAWEFAGAKIEAGHEIIQIDGFEIRPVEGSSSSELKPIKPTIEDLENALIEITDNMTTEEMEAELQEAGIDTKAFLEKANAIFKAAEDSQKITSEDLAFTINCTQLGPASVSRIEAQVKNVKAELDRIAPAHAASPSTEEGKTE